MIIAYIFRGEDGTNRQTEEPLEQDPISGKTTSDLHCRHHNTKRKLLLLVWDAD
jgi:hypothetical protein